MKDAAKTDFESCRERALTLLDRRAHSSAELACKLVQRGFSREVVAQVIARLQELRLLDDADFARAFVEEKRRSSRPVGRLKIISDLKRRGIGGEIMADVASDAEDAGGDADPELVRAVQAVRQRQRLSRPTPDARLERARLLRFLAGRGFTMDVARRAIQDMLGQSDEHD